MYWPKMKSPKIPTLMPIISNTHISVFKAKLIRMEMFTFSV